MPNLSGRLKHIVTAYLVRNLLKSITLEDILRQEGEHWYVGRTRISKEDMAALAKEAQDLKDSEIWKLMSREILFQTNLKMFEKARTDQDLVFGKAMLYLKELMDTFLNKIGSLQGFLMRRHYGSSPIERRSRKLPKSRIAGETAYYSEDAWQAILLNWLNTYDEGRKS